MRNIKYYYSAIGNVVLNLLNKAEIFRIQISQFLVIICYRDNKTFMAQLMPYFCQ